MFFVTENRPHSLLVKVSGSQDSISHRFRQLLLCFALLSWGGSYVHWQWAAILLVATVVLKNFEVCEEILLIDRKSNSVRLTVRYASGRLHQKACVDLSRVKIAINEGIRLQRVITFMIVLVSGEDKLLLPFEHFVPPMRILLPVYREVHMYIHHRP